MQLDCIVNTTNVKSSFPSSHLYYVNSSVDYLTGKCIVKGFPNFQDFKYKPELLRADDRDCKVVKSAFTTSSTNVNYNYQVENLFRLNTDNDPKQQKNRNNLLVWESATRDLVIDILVNGCRCNMSDASMISEFTQIDIWVEANKIILPQSCTCYYFVYEHTSSKNGDFTFNTTRIIARKQYLEDEPFSSVSAVVKKVYDSNENYFNFRHPSAAKIDLQTWRFTGKSARFNVFNSTLLIPRYLVQFRMLRKK